MNVPVGDATSACVDIRASPKPDIHVVIKFTIVYLICYAAMSSFAVQLM